MSQPRSASFKTVAWGALATLLVSAMGWALSANGRISALETDAATKQRIEHEIRQDLREVRERVARIEGKLDTALAKEK